MCYFTDGEMGTWENKKLFKASTPVKWHLTNLINIQFSNYSIFTKESNHDLCCRGYIILGALQNYIALPFNAFFHFLLLLLIRVCYFIFSAKSMLSLCLFILHKGMAFEYCAEQVALANQLWFEILKIFSCQTVREYKITVYHKITYLSLLHVLKTWII